VNLKIVKYNIDDLVVDPKEVSQNLNNLCKNRNIKWRVTGICQKEDVVIIALDECSSCTDEYLFRNVNAASVEEIEQEIQSHWQSGIFLLGIVTIDNYETLALFRKEK
jgi:hypothetical protein